MSDDSEDQYVYRFAGQEYDLETTVYDIPDNEIPNDSEITEEREGPRGTVIRVTRNAQFVRYPDGKHKRIRLGEGTLEHANIEVPDSALSMQPATSSAEQPKTSAKTSPDKSKKKTPREPQKSPIYQVNAKLETITNLFLDFGNKVNEVGNRLDEMNDQLLAFDNRVDRYNNQVNKTNRDLVNLKTLIQNLSIKRNLTSTSSDSALSSSSPATSDSEYSPIRCERPRKRKKPSTSPSTASSAEESELDQDTQQKQNTSHVSFPFPLNSVSHSTSIGKAMGGLNERIPLSTHKEGSAEENCDKVDRGEKAGGNSKKSGRDEPKRPPRPRKSPSPNQQNSKNLYVGKPESDNATDLRKNRPHTNRSSFNATNSTIDPTAFGSKSLQKMHERAVKVLPYRGPEEDPRAPLAYLEQFENRVVHRLGNDLICGEIFYDQIEQSPWCNMWINKIKADMGYKRMSAIFLQLEWTMEVQNLFYLQFLQANQRNTPYSNFLDFFNYWRERIRGVKVGDGYVIEHFRNNMPTRVQMKVDVTTVKTLKRFERIVKKIPETDLVWHDLSMPQGINKRKEALARRKGNPIPAPPTPVSQANTYKKFYQPKYNTPTKPNRSSTTCATIATDQEPADEEQVVPEIPEN